MKDDFDTLMDFMDVLKRRKLRESLLIAQTEHDCTVHVELAGVEIHFDFDENDNLVNIRRD